VPRFRFAAFASGGHVRDAVPFSASFRLRPKFGVAAGQRTVPKSGHLPRQTAWEASLPCCKMMLAGWLRATAGGVSDTA
jgi:hypothetical protein